MGEVLTLATKSGVDPEKLYQAIRGGLAGLEEADHGVLVKYFERLANIGIKRL